METIDTSFKMKCLIDMALIGEMSWHALDSLVIGLTQTLPRARQIIKTLLKEFETHQSICLKKKSDIADNVDHDISEDVIEIDEDLSITNEVKPIQAGESEEDGIEIIEEEIIADKLMPLKSEVMITIDNKGDLSNLNERDEFEENVSERETNLEEDIIEAIRNIEADSNNQFELCQRKNVEIDDRNNLPDQPKG